MIATFFMICAVITKQLWHILFILLRPFGFNTYMINNSQQVTKFISKLPKRSSMLVEDLPFGMIWGWLYIGYIEESGVNGPRQSATKTVTICTTPTVFKRLSANDEEGIVSGDKSLTMYNRSGHWFHLQYLKREIYIKKSKSTARPYQQDVIDKILEIYNEDRTCVAFLYGLPNTGK